MCDEVDEVLTDEGAMNWDTKLLSVLHRHITDYENQTEGTLCSLLSDMKAAIDECQSEEV